MQHRRVFPAAALVLAITMMPARAENPTPVANFDTILAESIEREFDELQRQLVTRHTWDLERLAREIHRSEALIHETDATPTHIALRRTRALLDHLRTMDGAPDLTAHAAALDALAEIPSTATEPALRAAFRDIAALRRRIALSNPRLDFTDILFIKRHRALYQHMCDQYYGIAGAPGLHGDVFAAHSHSEAFRSLAPFAWAKFGGNHHGITRNKTSYSIPGEVGARASKLLKVLEEGHHDVELNAEELRRITLWLDANSLFYGGYHDPDSQARGEKPQPLIE